MRVHKYLPIASIYLFLNWLALPMGMLYTSLLSPIIYLWLLKNGAKLVITRFICILAPFFFIHLIGGINFSHYVVTSLLLFSVYITAYGEYYFFNKNSNELDTLFDNLIFINFTIFILSIVLNISSMWSGEASYDGLENLIHRFMMFTYEPSYYSLIVSPFVCMLLQKS